MVPFERYARLADDEMNLLDGAVLLARDAYPSLDPAQLKAAVAELADGIGDTSSEPAECARELTRYLSEHCGFRGNAEDYYDPRNSYLNDVLERRVGIPISLAVLYLCVAEGHCEARGVAFPGHFLVRIETDGDAPPVLLDPFAGELADEARVLALARVAGGAPDEQTVRRWLAPASVRTIVVRMLTNLRAIYAARAELDKLLVVIDRIVSLEPHDLSAVRDRGLVQIRLGARRAGIADLARYLSGAPSAADADQIRALLSNLDEGRPN